MLKQTIRLLSVNDDYDTNIIFARFFEKLNEKYLTQNEFRHTIRGDEFLDLIPEFDPHVLLIDYNPLVHSGLDLCKIVRSQPAYHDKVIIVLLYGISFEFMLEYYLYTDHILNLPISREELETKIINIMQEERLWDG